MQQIPLTVSLPKVLSFNNFIASNHNEIVIDTLQQFIAKGSASVIGLQGMTGVGKSHLIQAAYTLACENHRCIYIPMRDILSLEPRSVLDDLHSNDFVFIDDIDAVFGLQDWEQALFHFYNRLSDANGCLLFSLCENLNESACLLPDLLSRLKLALLFTVNSLSDVEKEQALVLRALNLGINLSGDVVRYIFRHTHRDMATLMHLLTQLDQLSLTQKRKPSIPLVKQLLEPV